MVVQENNSGDNKMSTNRKKENIPIYRKQNLTIEEAAEYSNIGINRLNMLVRDTSCPFVLYVGNKRLIKRKKFDEYIETIEML